MSYKSRYSSNAWTDMLDAVANKRLVKDALKLELSNFVNTSENSIFNISAKPLDKEEIKFNFDGTTHLYMHTLLFENLTLKVLTHYPNKYKTLGDAVFDFGDTCGCFYNGNKILSFKYVEPYLVVNYILNGSIVTNEINYNLRPQEYYINKLGG